ncbi:peptidase family C50-domain-containing protein [Amylocystis lapponica]|nr:peptidase family C50-domain-containing protein [Amylocystis lapponica]
MPTAAGKIRTAPVRRAAPKSKAQPFSPDDLATKLATKLTISDPKGKTKAKSVSPEEARKNIMRTVNAASRSLSAAVESGWKPSDSAKTRSQLVETASAARNGISSLRELTPHEVDVERAASSVTGKLISLEMYDHALHMLSDMHPSLVALYVPQYQPPHTPPPLPFLSLPLPDGDVSDVLLSLLSTYLLHSILVHTHTTTDPSALDTALSDTPTLLTWLPRFSRFSPSQHDTLTTRAYTALAKRAAPHNVAFRLRVHALLCLVHTRPGVVSPITFWDQAVKFAAALAPATGEEHAVAREVARAFERLVVCAQARPDSEQFLSGAAFVGFCEFWMGIARRAGERNALDRAVELMRAADGLEVGEQGGMAAATVCAVLAQAAAVFDHWEGEWGADALVRCLLIAGATESSDDRALRVHDAALAVKKCRPFLLEHADKRAADRVRRALERLRRRTTKVLESDGTPAEARNGARVILVETAHILTDAISETKATDAETLSPALDTLLVLARTGLVISLPDSYTDAFDLLARAATLVKAGPADCVRCVSGAFYNVAGALYQAGRVAYAVRFLHEACVLGGQALDARGLESGAGEGKNAEAWRMLDEQLFRRWELLGVCQSKTGDRKLAYDALVEGVRAFPCVRMGVVQLVRTSALAGVFTVSTALTQLGGILDRATYLGVCELLRAPPELSARIWLEGVRLDDPAGDCMEGTQTWKCVVGALLERQAESLAGSRWKPGVRAVVRHLLGDALVVYVPTERPLRRARVLVRRLELAYHAGLEADDLDPVEIGDEVQALLSAEDASYDAGLVQFRQEYLASLHLWLALHAHRQGHVQPSSLILSHAEEACKILKAMLSIGPRPSLPKAKSPKQFAIAKKSAARTATGARGAPSRSRVPKAVKVVDPPVTPKPRAAFGDVSNAPLITTPKAAATTNKSALVFDDFPRLFSLLQMSQQLVGLLGYVLAKVHLLTMTRRLAEQHMGPSSNEYITASMDLAYEYIKLGRMEKAGTVYAHSFAALSSGETAPEVRILFLLRYAESLAAAGNVIKGSSIYCEALALTEHVTTESKGMSTAQRVKLRTAVLERAAIAAATFSVIQYSRDDPTTAVTGLLQSLRLWNRAADTLARLRPVPASKAVSDEDNPFDIADDKEARPNGLVGPAEQLSPRRTFQRKSTMDSTEWRIADGLMTTLFALAQAYLARGSPREAEYFVQQAHDLAESLNAPAMLSRALARNGEILLHLGRLEEGYDALMQAAELVAGVAGPDVADIRRLRGQYSQRSSNHKDAQQLYEEAIAMLDELGKMFSTYDGVAASARKSLGASPKSPKTLQTNDALAPALLAAVLRQHISLLHDAGAEYKVLLERLAALSHTAETKAEESALMAKLTLDDVYSRFRADMFLSSLAESAITIPMGMSGRRSSAMSPVTQDIVGTLAAAEKMFWSDLALIARRGNVSHVRDTAVSLALIRTLQTSLGKGGADAAVLAARLLDASTAITLQREMLEAIEHKYTDPLSFDDLRWPLITPNGSPLPPPPNARSRMALATLEDSDEEPDNTDEQTLKRYWESLRDKYRADLFSAGGKSPGAELRLPPNWTVVNVSITEDKNTMFITRQRADEQPLIFCLPLKGRRDNQDDEHLTFGDAMAELKEIIRLSDEGTRQAANIRKDDRSARTVWWADRAALDKRLQELLENIEFCWLGAFKTIFNECTGLSAADTAAFRARLDKVFAGSRVLRDKRQKGGVRLDDTLLRCFSTLPPSCRDEELEDLVYFILDLYQFHGVPVAIAEVDVDQVIVDLRSALEEHAARLKGGPVPTDDTHTFLVLDKNVQGIPWESLPTLRGKSVSRIPSMAFLLDRIQYVQVSKGHVPSGGEARTDRAAVDPRKTYYVLNPAGDLKGTEARFASWLADMKPAGWDGVVGRAPSEQQFIDALARNDLVIYFGHGGAEQYVRSHKIRHLPRCAATMLWGCSSGALKEMGDFDRIGTPYNYMLAGCPTLVANMWDVTDRDIDKFSQAVFDDLRLTPVEVQRWRPEDGETGKRSVVSAVARAREKCKLKYLTGAAPVVYGIPFYL